MKRQSAAIRRHPVRWALFFPVLSVGYVALRLPGNHPGQTGWIVGLSLALAFGLCSSAYAIHRAKQQQP